MKYRSDVAAESYDTRLKNITDAVLRVVLENGPSQDLSTGLVVSYAIVQAIALSVIDAIDGIDRSKTNASPIG